MVWSENRRDMEAAQLGGDHDLELVVAGSCILAPARASEGPELARQNHFLSWSLRSCGEAHGVDMAPRFRRLQHTDSAEEFVDVVVVGVVVCNAQVLLGVAVCMGLLPQVASVGVP